MRPREAPARWEEQLEVPPGKVSPRTETSVPAFTQQALTKHLSVPALAGRDTPNVKVSPAASGGLGHLVLSKPQVS